VRRRLTRAFGAMIGFTIIGIGFVVCVLAYGIQVRALVDTCDQTRRIVDDVAVAYHVSQYDGLGKLNVIMTHVYQPGFLVVVNEHGTRYDGRWVGTARNARSAYAVTMQPRPEYLQHARSRPFPARAVHWLAALAGYRGSLSHIGKADIAVIADPAQLAAIAWRTIIVMVMLVPLALAVGYAVGRAMSHKAVQPLVMVSEALEAFAAGKLVPALRPRGIRADELDRLALAYNAAMETVHRAFDERARVEMQTRQFISDASHQLRTPLTVLRGFIGILRRGEFDTAEEFSRIVETMDGQSAIMTSLMRKLMLLETWDNAAARRDDVIDVAAAVEQIVVPIAESHRHRDVQLDLADGAFAAIDPDELGYAIGNLVTNALNYAPEGVITVEVSTAGNEVHIVVADQGPGMNDDELAHAFDRFFRGARRDVAGSGLGLAIAKRAVERADGTLTVVSRLGAGCRFTIVLPLAPVPARQLVATA
jgi:signal transduction histidine kinase